VAWEVPRPNRDHELVDSEARRHSKRSLADSCSEVPGLTISGTPQAASVRARIRDRYFIEVVFSLGKGEKSIILSVMIG